MLEEELRKNGQLALENQQLKGDLSRIEDECERKIQNFSEMHEREMEML